MGVSRISTLGGFQISEKIAVLFCSSWLLMGEDNLITDDALTRSLP